MNERPCVVVTGATGGIGSAIAAKLAGEGFRLVLTGRKRERLDAVAGPLVQNDNIRVVPGDIRDSTTVDSLVSAALEAWGRLDVIVNNAGIASRVDIGDVDNDLLLREMETNAFGPARLIVKAWPIFVLQRSGVIVNVSSLASTDPFAGFFSYGASKAALESLARSAAREGKDLGIRAYNIALGAVATPLLDALFGESAPQAPLQATAVAKVVLACIRGDGMDARDGTITLASDSG